MKKEYAIYIINKFFKEDELAKTIIDNIDNIIENISTEFFIDIFESDLSREDSKKVIFDKINSIIDISKHQNIKETTILLEILMSTLFFEDLLLTFFKEESLDETI